MTRRQRANTRIWNWRLNLGWRILPGKHKHVRCFRSWREYQEWMAWG